MSLSPKHELDSRPIPAHPYRDSALFHGVLALVILALAGFTNGGVGRAGLIALGYFVAATSWSWWRFHERIKARAREERSQEAGEA